MEVTSLLLAASDCIGFLRPLDFAMANDEELVNAPNVFLSPAWPEFLRFT